MIGFVFSLDGGWRRGAFVPLTHARLDYNSTVTTDADTQRIMESARTAVRVPSTSRFGWFLLREILGGGDEWVGGTNCGIINSIYGGDCADCGDRYGTPPPSWHRLLGGQEFPSEGEQQETYGVRLKNRILRNRMRRS